MKKNIYVILMILLCFITTACKDSASMAVERYLSKYNNLDTEVLTDMQNIVEKENLSEENKKLYQNIFEKQYSDLSYKIVEEEYNGNEATIDVQITVYDLYKVQNDANNYLINHPEEFENEDGVYNPEIFIKYKLQQMKNNLDTVDYTLEFYVVKTKSGWEVSSLSTSDLEKIHGIYDYNR